ncbi:MmyB family transcriptional regulator [Sinosporangium siamense]|uniref:MmyB family transcriptional regulator n=1 Tax=Sinosporangium siamense TaxID=1367973 RepID=UPI001EF1F776|nr:hypothetical protein [Sinosporangium siamense]
MRALLERLDPTPAVVVDRVGDVLAHTRGYARLAGPLGLLEGRPPNLSRYVFTDKRARRAFPEWGRLADHRAKDLRAAVALGDPRAVALAEELSSNAGVGFSGRYQAWPAMPARTGVERWAHPEAGELLLAYESLDLADGDERRLIVYLPADDATSAALDRLT